MVALIVQSESDLPDLAPRIIDARSPLQLLGGKHQASSDEEETEEVTSQTELHQVLDNSDSPAQRSAASESTITEITAIFEEWLTSDLRDRRVLAQMVWTDHSIGRANARPSSRPSKVRMRALLDRMHVADKQWRDDTLQELWEGLTGQQWLMWDTVAQYVLNDSDDDVSTTTCSGPILPRVENH